MCLSFTDFVTTFVNPMVRIMNNRLEQFLAAENISQSQFADTIDVARASVSHIISGRNKPGWDFLNNMMRHYPNLNIEWLLNGTGKMYKSQQREEIRKAEEVSADLFTPPAAVQEAPETSRESQIAVPAGNLAGNTESTRRNDSPAAAHQMLDSQKKITKIVVFYDDNTFIEIK